MDQETLNNELQEFYEYLRVDAERAATTSALRRRIAKRVLRELGTLTPSGEDVDRMRRQMMLTGCTQDHGRNFVFAMRDWFAFKGIPEEGEKLKVPKKSRVTVPRYFTEDEVRAVLDVIEDTRDRALFNFMAFTGFRLNEVLTTPPEDVDLETRTVRVLGKGAKHAEIPLAEMAVEPMKRWLKVRDPDARYLFYPQGDKWSPPQPSKPLSAQRVRVLLRRYAKAAGINKRVHPHMFRHALATNLLENGCPLPFVQRQLRHSRAETTQRYLHASSKAFRQNYDRFVPNY